jgi:hypothetical protein
MKISRNAASIGVGGPNSRTSMGFGCLSLVVVASDCIQQARHLVPIATSLQCNSASSMHHIHLSLMTVDLLRSVLFLIAPLLAPPTWPRESYRPLSIDTVHRSGISTERLDVAPFGWQHIQMRDAKSGKKLCSTSFSGLGRRKFCSRIIFLACSPSANRCVMYLRRSSSLGIASRSTTPSR